MDYPTCLVVCSKPNGADFKAFNAQLSNIFETQFNYDFIDAIYEPLPKYFPLKGLICSLKQSFNEHMS